MFPRPIDGLPVRITSDLKIEADPGAQLTPKQGIALAENIVDAAVRLAAAEPRRRPAGTKKAPR